MTGRTRRNKQKLQQQTHKGKQQQQRLTQNTSIKGEENKGMQQTRQKKCKQKLQTWPKSLTL